MFGLLEVELGAAPHHLLAVADVLVDERPQRQDLGALVDQRQHDGAEGHLERRVDEQLVEHDARVGVLLELDDDPHAVAVGLVA